METNSIIAIALAIVIAFLIIKFLAKAIFKLIGIAITILVLIGFLYYADYIDINEDKKIELSEKSVEKLNLSFSIEELKNKHCSGKLSREDSLKCTCIITPLYKYISENYTEEDLQAMQKNKFKALKEFRSIINNNKESILERLRKNDAEYLWAKFMDELKSGIFSKKD